MRLAEAIQNQTGVVVDPDSIFDVQIKRIHEYKRQLLAVMNVIHDYLRIVEHGEMPASARTYLFAGKAAPGYWAAKQIIKLIHNVAAVVNNDERVKDAIKVTFLPDYRVSLATLIIPGADLSEQISTAGMEASGTGNMKLAMNGALTIGTWDGANIEIAEEVGLDNIFIFGLRAEQILEMQKKGSYNPRERYDNDPDVKEVLDALASDRFCPNEHGLFRWIFDELVHRGDRYYHIADFPSYVETQKRVCERIPERRSLVPQGSSQCGPHRKVLQRPHRDGVRPRHLAHRALRKIRGRWQRTGQTAHQPASPAGSERRSHPRNPATE